MCERPEVQSSSADQFFTAITKYDSNKIQKTTLPTAGFLDRVVKQDGQVLQGVSFIMSLLCPKSIVVNLEAMY